MLDRDEVRSLLNALNGVPRLAALLLYGTGMRVLECLRLRVKDADFARNEITVRSGKGDNDRVVPLPLAAKPHLHAHMDGVRAIHQRDLARGLGRVSATASLGPEVLERRVRVGVAVDLSGLHALHGPAIGDSAPAPSARDSYSAIFPSGSGEVCDYQGSDPAHSPARLRDAPAGRRGGYPDSSGAAGAFQRRDDDDLHSRPESGRTGHREPCGPSVNGICDRIRQTQPVCPNREGPTVLATEVLFGEVYGLILESV